MRWSAPADRRDQAPARIVCSSGATGSGCVVCADDEDAHPQTNASASSHFIAETGYTLDAN